MEYIKLTISVQEASEISGIGKDTLYKLINDNNSDLPCFKVNSRAFINHELFRKWLSQLAIDKRQL